MLQYLHSRIPEFPLNEHPFLPSHFAVKTKRFHTAAFPGNHFDRFYAYSTEKIASMCLQERIVKAMGYRVSDCYTRHH